MTWNGKVTKKSNTAPDTDPRAWVWQNYSEWVVFITTRSPGWHSRDKVDESTVTSCTFFLQQGQRGSKGSCLNHDHFEAPTSNYSLTWLRSIGFFFQNTTERYFSYLDFTHLYSQNYLPCFVQWLIWRQLYQHSLFSPKTTTVEKLFSTQAARISFWLPADLSHMQFVLYVHWQIDFHKKPG